MTQVNRAQRPNNKVASISRARVRTLAHHRADFEQQVRSYLAQDATMALTDLSQVSARLKELRALAGNPKQREVARDLGDMSPRTFQSWENGEVETDKENYERIARYYSKRLKRRITANWILFGQDEAPEPKPITPDLAAALNGNKPDDDLRAQLNRIEAALNDLADRIKALSDLLEPQVEELASRVLALEETDGRASADTSVPEKIRPRPDE